MTLIRRTCRVCDSTFEYDPARFIGFRPPCLCLSCNQARRARLVFAEGFVIRIAETGAYVKGDAGGRYFWRYTGEVSARPRLGDRVSFRFDPEEMPTTERWRLPLARHALIKRSSEVTR